MFTLTICTVDRTAPLERLLHSLARQSDRDFEIIVVDQNLDDRLAALLETLRPDDADRPCQSTERLYHPPAIGAFVSRVETLSDFPMTTAITPLRCLSVYASDLPPPQISRS